MIMAVKVVDRKVVITLRDNTDGEDVYIKITTLLNLLMSIDEEMLCKNDVYEVAKMIEELLPDRELFYKMFKE